MSIDSLVQDVKGTQAVLSTAHISRKKIEDVKSISDKSRINLWLDAGLIKIQFPDTSLVKNHTWGYRGNATFSPESRRRLMRKLAMVDRRYVPQFVTLTYPDAWPDDPKIYKRQFDNFCKALKYRHPEAGLIWKLEFQARGAPHFHLLVWGVPLGELRAFVPMAWYKIAGAGDEKHYLWHMGVLGNGNRHCVQQVFSYKQVSSYASKYMGKDEKSRDGVGRFWGVRYRECIPFVVPITIPIHDLSIVKQMMRYMRRYMSYKVYDKSGKFLYQRKVKGRSYHSLYMICNPDRWLDLLAWLSNQ